MTATATVFLGTFYPLFIDAIAGDKISVGAPYFDLTFAPIMCVLILFMGIGPMLKWRTDTLSRVKKPILIAAIGFAIIAVLTALIGKTVPGAIAMGLAAWLAIGTIIALYRKANGRWAGLRVQPAATWGFVGAHLGLAMFTAAVTAMTVWADTDIGTLKPGESLTLSPYEFTLQDIGDQLAGDTGAFDSDADLSTGVTSEVILESGEHNPTLDAGIYALDEEGNVIENQADTDAPESNEGDENPADEPTNDQE